MKIRRSWVLAGLGWLAGCGGGAYRPSPAGGVAPEATASAAAAPLGGGVASTVSAGAANAAGTPAGGAGGAGAAGGSNTGGLPPTPRGAAAGFDDFDDFDQPRKPPEVTRENEQFRADFPELDPVRRLPDFLSVDAVVALLPATEDREGLRQRLHRQLDGEDERSVMGAYLDDEQRLFLLWLDTHALTQVLAVYASGRLASKLETSRARASLRELLPEADGVRPELVLQRITSPSVCCLPLSLEIYRIGKLGRVSAIFTHARGHVDVGPGERWSFLNHFEFDGERLTVSSVLPKGGSTYEYVFDARAGRYRPTAATQRLLSEEQRRRAARNRRRGKLDYEAWPDGAAGFE